MNIARHGSDFTMRKPSLRFLQFWHIKIDSFKAQVVNFSSFCTRNCCFSRSSMAPRWKWKGAEAKALAEPVSTTISELRSSLIRSEASGFLSSCSILLVVEPEQAELLDNGCFGRPIVSAEKDKRWFQLSLEEAFFLFHNLKCIKISIQDRFLDNETEVWRIMKSKKANFPVYYKAYSHLRSKNWILRSGLQYGVDFVAYRHHPSLVHSEYAVLVQPGDGYGGNFRLRVWSDIHCAVRLCGSVAKTLLVLYVNGDCKGEDLSSCLENYTVEEQTITRWSPEQSRENETSDQSRVNARTIKPLTSS